MPKHRTSKNRHPLVAKIRPAERDFYSKVLHYQGIPIKSAEVVDDQALLEAWQRMHMMLRSTPKIVANLKSHEAELHIIGKDQVPSDLPENLHYKGKPFDGDLDIDQRTRGTGGLHASCGEENLLKLKEDRYYGRDICVHEFAHTIFTYGLDESAREQIIKCYDSARRKRLWPGCYAKTSVHEYFAELTMWFFGTQGDPGKISPSPKTGPTWLQSYDPVAFSLLDELFAGRMKIKKALVKRLTPRSPKLESKLKSSASKVTTSIHFVNQSKMVLKVYWLDYRGKRKLYSTLEPGNSYTQQTFVTHPWVVTDTHERAKAIFVPESRSGVAIVTARQRS